MEPLIVAIPLILFFGLIFAFIIYGVPTRKCKSCPPASDKSVDKIRKAEDEASKRFHFMMKEAEDVKKALLEPRYFIRVVFIDGSRVDSKPYEPSGPYPSLEMAHSEVRNVTHGSEFRRINDLYFRLCNVQKILVLKFEEPRV